MKVQDLARNLGKSTKELMAFLRSVRIRVDSATAQLDDATVRKIRQLMDADVLGSKKVAGSEPVEAIVMVITSENMTVGELVSTLGVRLPDVMRVVLEFGMLLNLNSVLDFRTAVLIGEKLGFELKRSDTAASDATNALRISLDRIEEVALEANLDTMITRPPVVTIMGHVDHGKTLLLDTIRRTNVVAKEAGGITQHIGAYQVDVKGRKITFLDTPGHAAFTALRARGAQVTDIVILVIAADEGIKPQTIEALHHAKAAGVPIIVAANKMDRPDADVEKLKQQLAENDLLPEDWGGKTVVVPISAKANTGVDQLLEMILLVADMADLQASEKGLGRAVVIESRLSRKKGPVATVLVKSGTLRVGDFFVIGHVLGKIRALQDDAGNPVPSATPSTPVEVMGISEVPKPGDILEVFPIEREARKVAEARFSDAKEAKTQGTRHASLEALTADKDAGGIRKLSLIVKADVNGSLEAIVGLIEQLRKDDIDIGFVHTATGPVTENDVMLATASDAIVIAFGVSVGGDAEKMAAAEGIQIKSYRIIYDIVEDLKKVLEGLYRPEFEEIEIGKAEVRQIFTFSKVGKIAGSYVLSGKMVRNGIVAVERSGKQVFKGKLDSLRRFKDDAREVASGFECGVVLDGFGDLGAGDIVYCFELREKKR